MEEGTGAESSARYLVRRPSVAGQDRYDGRRNDRFLPAFLLGLGSQDNALVELDDHLAELEKDQEGNY